MTIVIEPTKIKQSYYLLVPKNIAELVEITKSTKFALNIKQAGKKQVLEYHINGQH